MCLCVKYMSFLRKAKVTQGLFVSTAVTGLTELIQKVLGLSLRFLDSKIV